MVTRSLIAQPLDVLADPEDEVARELPGYRIRTDVEPVRIQVDGVARSLRLTRLSLADLTVLADDATLFPYGYSFTLRLPGELAVIPAVVVDVRPVAEGAEITFFFGDMRVEVGLDVQTALIRLLARGLAVLPPRRARESEVIRSTPRIRAILRWLFASGGEGRVFSTDDPSATATIRAARFDPASATPLHFDVDADAWPPPPLSIEFLGHSSFFRFRADKIARASGLLALPMPTQMVRTRHRWQRRVAAPPDVFVTFRHPQWPSLTIRRPVRDLSLDGIGFSASRLEDLLYPGLTARDVAIEWQERLRIEFSGTVRHTSARAGEPEHAGMSLEPRRSDDRDHWAEKLYGLLYPNTRMDGSWCRDLWTLYDRSGYFNLSNKKENDFSDVREPFERTSRQVAHHPELGCQVVWPSRRGIEATVSVLKIYDASTCIYQLARERGRTPSFTSGRQILRDLYLHAVEHTLRDGGLRWLVEWVQDVAHFSRLLHYDLPRRYLEAGRAHISHFHAMEGRCDRPSPPPAPGFEVAPATPGEIERLLERLAVERDAAFLDAHDLVPERFDLARIKHAWAAAGLVREREVIAVHAPDGRAASAIVESADDGLHLFGLFDVVRLFAHGERGAELFPSLLEAARGWFAGRGKRKFVYFLEGSDLAHATQAGFVDLGGASLTLLPVELLPELIEQLYELTAPREAE